MENGGPKIPGEPQATGFGTMLAQLSVVNQLGGTLDREWKTDGLELRASIPRAALAR